MLILAIERNWYLMYEGKIYIYKLNQICIVNAVPEKRIMIIAMGVTEPGNANEIPHIYIYIYVFK